jgi:uncharacterized protein YijF (DUF1287 family)
MKATSVIKETTRKLSILALGLPVTGYQLRSAGTPIVTSTMYQIPRFHFVLKFRIAAMFRPRAAVIAILSCALALSVLAQQSNTRTDFTKKLVAAAVARTKHNVRYEPAYIRIPYPGGDVPSDTGVCTDEIIRIYRTLGIDLQKLVHEDMSRRFSRYPKKWGKKQPDSNIDHRRVPNLATFFEFNGEKLPITRNDADYQPGDIVTWDLGGGVPHIGMVVDQQRVAGRYMIEHNIGAGPKIEDVLFSWEITGHFRYFGPSSTR